MGFEYLLLGLAQVICLPIFLKYVVYLGPSCLLRCAGSGLCC